MTDTIAVEEQDYGADQIQALEGLEPVRTRPGMYIGSTGKSGFHHLLWEVVDNSVDEAMGGYADRILVTLNGDNSITVTDNGRGIPVAPQKNGTYAGISTVEMVCTVLHAGGKFDESAYQFSGGLHGVGISVVNALSEKMAVDVNRDGKAYRVEFGAVDKVDDSGSAIMDRRGNPAVSPGMVTSPLQEVGTSKHTGTSVTFLPDERVFSSSIWDEEVIARRLRQGAFLNPGLTFILQDNRAEDASGHTEVVYHYPNGLLDFMTELSGTRLEQSGKPGEKDRLMPHTPILLGGKDADIRGEWEICMRWFPDQWYRVNSFANGIETQYGGAHVKGYEQVLTTLMNRYAKQDHIGFLKNSEKLEAVDVRSGLGVILTVKVKEPQFVGQTKDELSNDETRKMTRSGFQEQFWSWMEEHPVEIGVILDKCISEMRIRHKVAAEEDKERNKAEKKGVAAKSQPLPTKLSDCESRDWVDRELFIVEGDSAAGPAKMSRDTHFQAVLPIRGKGLNIENALNSRNAEDRIQGNVEVQGILAAIGAGSMDLFDVDAMRYGKIIIMTDADDDGAHIQLLLMTTFYRLCKPLVEAGKLYVARPPLFSANHKGKKHFLNSMAEREEFEEKHATKDTVVTRFKGLGEMNSGELGQTCINPATRHIAQIQVEDASVANEAIVNLMGGNADAKWSVLQDVVVDESAISA